MGVISSASRLAPHVVQRLAEVRQLVVEGVHHRHARRLDLEALGPPLEHALVGGPQVFVLLLRELVQAAFDVGHAVHRTQLGDRDVRGAHGHQIVRTHVEPPRDVDGQDH
jgi:hypothetical protein